MRALQRMRSPAAAAAALLLAALLMTPLARLHASEAVRPVEVPPHERVTLDNGAVLLLTERRDVPLLAFTALLRGGAMSDPQDALGVSSVLAGLLEKGAGERDALEFARTVASVGGSIQTSAATDSIAVSGSFLARDAQLMVELLADMLQRPRLEPAEFAALRDRRIEFIRAAKDSDLASLTPIYGAAALFGAHPYGRPVNGGEASLAALKHDDVKRHYREHMGADRLIVSVAGDFETSQMQRLLRSAFSGWRKARSPAPEAAAPQPTGGPRVLLIDAPDSVQSYFWVGAPGVARADPRRAALDVVNTLFGGRFTSMLNNELRVRTGLSYGAGSRFDRLAAGGHWQMTSFTQTPKTIEAIDLALATLDKLHTGAFEPAALESSRNYVLGQFPLGFETASQWALQLAALELYGLDRSYIEGYAPALQAVSIQDARRVVDQVFPRSDQTTLVVIGAASQIRDGLRKYGPVTEMKLSAPVFHAPQR
ncbi:MAG TPA: pitrilysin family protein [Steroidobacter sp.]|nr:pitrilysin family protein [Steroidobacter sp.]